ncbi:MAG: hypothetical protein AB7P69_13610 [Candidatus Binatia bacterium]
MTDEETRGVYEQVETILASREGRALDIGNPEHLTLLGNAARSVCPGVAEDELLLVTTMCWLGPLDAGPPPAPLREELLHRLRQDEESVKERTERVMEFVIAYGCGKWRTVEPGYGGWAQRWQGALRGLVRALEPAVGQTNRWLAEHVAGFPKDRGISHDPQFREDTPTWSDAWMLANKFVRPVDRLCLEEGEALTISCTEEGTECMVTDQDYQQFVPPGAKALWTVQAPETTTLFTNQHPLVVAAGTTFSLIARDDDVLIKTALDKQNRQAHLKVGEEAEMQGPLTLSVWECTCGTTHCEERHRLEAWDPVQRVQKTVTHAGSRKKEETTLTLWNFVASAVKGPQMRIQTGSFVQGLYFPLLSEEGCGQ